MSIGRSIKHDSILGHVSGASVYIDDRPTTQNEVHVGIIPCPINCGEILSIDFSEAKKIPGFLGEFTADDLFHNQWGTIKQDQPILASKYPQYHSEPIAAFAVEDRQLIPIIQKLVKVQSKASANPILDLPSYFRQQQQQPNSVQKLSDEEFILYQAPPMQRGQAELQLAVSEHQLTGEFYIGGQEHFYLESQACIAYPGENGQMEVHSSSQHPTETQHVVAHALGLEYHQVTCVVKRMGGAFGGKESQAAPLAAVAALVAQKLNRPARLILTKDEDMKITGKRHPFLFKYQVGFNSEGIIQALLVDMFADGGAYTDLSPSILDRAMFHLDGAYYLSHVRINGAVIKTNSASNTAFRGFGGPQGTFLIENIMEEISAKLKIDSLMVRQKNVYNEIPVSKNSTELRNTTHYGQVLENNVLPELFSKLTKDCAYHAKRKSIEEFNQKNKYKVRGLSCTATKFGIAFTAQFLNQANALVQLHRDGTVQVSTGATEMGQGVNTKIQQTVAWAFGISPEKVIVMPTSTEKNANTSPTAASSGSDLNAAAALEACRQIKRNLCQVAAELWQIPFSNLQTELQKDSTENFKIKTTLVNSNLILTPNILDQFVFDENKVLLPEMNQQISLVELIQHTYMKRVALGAYGHFKTPRIGYDKSKQQGMAFNYFTNGACVSEVEIDELTGEVKVLSSDILMDIGNSMNPAIDKGQIAGAFIQGQGWVTTEVLKYANGDLLSHSPTTYKIPNIQDIPRHFKIELLDNPKNHFNIFGSKAVGEPPFLLAISVWTAIKNAISYRVPNTSQLKSPATCEEVLKCLNKAL